MCFRSGISEVELRTRFLILVLPEAGCQSKKNNKFARNRETLLKCASKQELIVQVYAEGGGFFMADLKREGVKFAVQTSRRRSDQAFQQILALIFEGRLSPGSRLPGERELTETFGFSRTTLRDALTRLEARGYINRRSKSGSFVCTSLPQPFREPIEEIVDSNVISTSDIIEIRKVLELWAVAKASHSPGKELLAALARCLRVMQATSAFKTDGQFTRYRDADLKFHQTIAEMTGNLLYVHLFHFFLDLVRRSISLSRQFVPGDFAKDNLRNHQEVYRAIEKRDSDRARHAMLEHFRYVEQHISAHRRPKSTHRKKSGVLAFRSPRSFS